MPEEKKQSSLWEIIKFTIIAVLIVLPIRLWVAQPFIVSGPSMEPTFNNGDYLIVDELSYRFENPKIGDVIVFRYPLDPTKFFIKRIEGLPGDKVNVLGNEVTLGPDEYYVLGDNSPQSSDSRIWGPVSKNLIVGKALVRLWPLNEMGVLPGQKI
jgi:signal peptidase I